MRGRVCEGEAQMDAASQTFGWDTSASRAAAPSCAMELPSDDDGASPALLPSFDDGQIELPQAVRRQFQISQRDPRHIKKRRRRGPASRGDHPPALLPSDDDGHTSDTTLSLPWSLAGHSTAKPCCKCAGSITMATSRLAPSVLERCAPRAV